MSASFQSICVVEKIGIFLELSEKGKPLYNQHVGF
jgi:hypothetical protein